MWYILYHIRCLIYICLILEIFLLSLSTNRAYPDIFNPKILSPFPLFKKKREIEKNEKKQKQWPRVGHALTTKHQMTFLNQSYILSVPLTRFECIKIQKISRISSIAISATSCNLLTMVAMSFNQLQSVAISYNQFQSVAINCNQLQSVAKRCNQLQLVQSIAIRCNQLQSVATKFTEVQ